MSHRGVSLPVKHLATFLLAILLPLASCSSPKETVQALSPQEAKEAPQQVATLIEVG